MSPTGLMSAMGRGEMPSEVGQFAGSHVSTGTCSYIALIVSEEKEREENMRSCHGSMLC